MKRQIPFFSQDGQTAGINEQTLRSDLKAIKRGRYRKPTVFTYRNKQIRYDGRNFYDMRTGKKLNRSNSKKARKALRKTMERQLASMKRTQGRSGIFG